MQSELKTAVFEALTIEDEGRVCKDIPDSASAEQPENFLKHVLALAAAALTLDGAAAG